MVASWGRVTSPLHAAVRKGHDYCLEPLLKYDVNFQTGFFYYNKHVLICTFDNCVAILEPLNLTVIYAGIKFDEIVRQNSVFHKWLTIESL